jgi:hypothetical protein
MPINLDDYNKLRRATIPHPSIFIYLFSHPYSLFLNYSCLFFGESRNRDKWWVITAWHFRVHGYFLKIRRVLVSKLQDDPKQLQN